MAPSMFTRTPEAFAFVQYSGTISELRDSIYNDVTGFTPFEPPEPVA